MNRVFENIWREDDGVLSFEWTIIAVVIVFGIVGGLAAIRDVIIDELGDLGEAVVAFDQSFSFSGIASLGLAASSYTDIPSTVIDCGRHPLDSWGVPAQNDAVDGG